MSIEACEEGQLLERGGQNEHKMSVQSIVPLALPVPLAGLSWGMCKAFGAFGAWCLGCKVYTLLRVINEARPSNVVKGCP